MKLGLLFSVLLLSVVSWGQIVTFDFAGLIGSEASVNSNYNDINLNASTITRGLGLTASPNGDRFNSTNWATTSIANAVIGNDYIEFTIIPKPGYQFSINSIVFLWQRSATGSTAIALRSSIDGFATNLDSQKGISDDNLTQIITFSFLQTNTTSVTYRLYGYSEATLGSAGPEGIGNDIIVNGSVSLIGPYSITSGDWNVGSTWSTNSVPLNSDNVTISTGHVVYTNTALTRNGVTQVDGTFELRDGGWATGTGTFLYNSTLGTLNFNLSSGSYGVNNSDIYWPNVNGPFNVNVLNAGMNLNSGANRTVNGTFSTANAGVSNISFSSATLTLNGICRIDSGGAFGNSPIFGNASTLQYNSNGTYGRGLEWSYNGVGTIGITPGYPNNVEISNNTVLNYTNGTPLNKAIAGNLTIDSGSSFYMDYGSVSASGFLTVAGNFINNGNFTLGFAVGDDLKLGGDFINTGNFDGKDRAIFFLKNGIQTISSSNPLTIPYVVFQPISGSTTIQLLSDLFVSASLGGNAISFSNASDVFDLNNKSLTIGTIGKNNLIIGDGTFKGSLNSNMTMQGMGSIGILRFTSGSQILNNLTLNRQTSSIGFDLGSDISINGTLALTNGIANLSSYTMIITLSGVITGSSNNNYIIADLISGGKLRKNFNTSGSFSFPIGDSMISTNGTQYSPATVNFISATFSSGWIALAVDDTKEPNCNASTDYISRYWNLTSSGITNATYDFIGTYLPIDIVGTETTCISTRYSTSNNSWTDRTNLVLGANQISLSGLTSATGALTSPNHFTAAYRDQEIRVERSTASLIPTGSLASSGYDTDFGSQVIFTASAPKTYTIRNIGNANLTVFNPTLSGTNPGDFIISPTSTTTIAGNSTATFTIVFNPIAIGTRTAIVKIFNNDADENPYTFEIIGNGICSTGTNIITPTSGPVGTEVTINSTDVLMNDLTSATAMINNISATVSLVSNAQIKIKIPNGAISGNIFVTNTMGCPFSNPFTVIDNMGNTCQGSSVASDLFMSEVTDATSGGLTYIEIYNGTGVTKNLSSYSIKTASNGAGYSSTLILNNINLPNGSVYVVALGSDGLCSVPGGDGSYANQIGPGGGINFDVNGNDHFGLFNGSTLIDSFGTFGSNSWASLLGLGDRGATFRRKNTVTLPKPVYSDSDWDIIDWAGTGSTSCATNDYSNIGTYNFLTGLPPTVTLHPTYTPTCKSTSLTVSANEGYNGISPSDTKELAYQWYVNIPPDTNWIAINDDAIYSGTKDLILNITDISGLINNQYYCQIKEDSNTCYTATNAIQITDGEVAIWNGTWVNGPPTLDKLVIINADYNTLNEGSFDACSLIVNASKTLIISSDDYANIKNDLTVNGNLFVENNGSLVQIDDNGQNTGDINVNRIAQARNLDYVYWSSPVSGFLVNSLPNTHHYEWGPTSINANGTEGYWIAPTTATMSKGKGYIARASNGATTPQDLPVNFIGIPFNGKFNLPISRGSNTNSIDDNWNLVGNPYPSAINADDFLYQNANPIGPNPVLEGAIHIWTHGTLPKQIASPFYENFVYNYTANDFIIYNSLGVTSGPNTFYGKIASGQGFFVKMIDGIADNSKSIVFKNDMRRKDYDNSNFYKTVNHYATNSNALEKSRIWLDLIKTNGSSSRVLVGYIQGATTGKDVMFDAHTQISEMCLYSLIDDEIFAIQGRPLPFESDDKTPLGINIPSKDKYTIAINAVDGLFLNSSQNIFLEDLDLHLIHDLRLSPYEFIAEKGKFDNRFILRFTNTNLDIKNISSTNNSLFVLSNNNQIKIKSTIEVLENVVVYDVLGREIFNQKKVNSKELIIENIYCEKQILIVKIDFQNGKTISRKIILFP